mmetsp:Transcript_12669/g.36243  ORF Transcript_12669/g.36243 Transcript_12669/m.36243 type:complete len:204 (+) Transcript_12669:850-1461(+)
MRDGDARARERERERERERREKRKQQQQKQLLIEGRNAFDKFFFRFVRFVLSVSSQEHVGFFSQSESKHVLEAPAPARQQGRRWKAKRRKRKRKRERESDGGAPASQAIRRLHDRSRPSSGYTHSEKRKLLEIEEEGRESRGQGEGCDSCGEETNHKVLRRANVPFLPSVRVRCTLLRRPGDSRFQRVRVEGHCVHAQVHDAA